MDISLTVYNSDFSRLGIYFVKCIFNDLSIRSTSSIGINE